MRRLLNEYEKKLKLVSQKLTEAINDASDLNVIIKLTVMRKCYQIFIAELKEIAPPAKPVNQKELDEEKKRREEAEKLRDEELEAFNQRLLNGDFEDKEPEYPKGF